MTPKNYKPGKQRVKYSYNLGLARTEVCKKTFKDTLAIGDAYLKGVNRRRDPETWVVRPYKRGKGKINYNKISFI